MEYIPILFKSIESKCPVLSPVYYPNGITEMQVLKRVKIPKEPSKCDICGSEDGPRLAQVFFHYDLKQRKASIASVKVLSNNFFHLVFVSTMQVCSQSRQGDGVTCELKLQ